MYGCRVDKVDVVLGYGLGSYNMPMYVADINDDCILGLDYLKARGAVIDLGRGVLEVEVFLVTGKYKYANDTSSSIYRPNSVTRVFVTIQISGNQPVVIHEMNKRRQYLVPNALMMSGNSRSLYLVNDSDEHINLNTCSLVAHGEDARSVQSIVVTSATTGGVKNQEKLYGIINMTNTDVHSVLKLSADSKCSSALLDKSKVMGAHAFRERLMSHLPDHMKDMFLRVGSELSNDQVLKVYSLLATDLGSITAVKHHNDTGDARPIKQRMRRTPLVYANEEMEHLEKLLEAGVIESSASEWASPSVLVRKRDGSVRWCIDLRKFNDVTVYDCFTLPLLQDCIDALEECQYYTTLDMTSGYYQLEVAEEDRDKTAFVTKYCIVRMGRWSGGTELFCRYYDVSLVLRGISWKSVIAFLDDVVILGRDFDNHLRNFSEVLRRFDQYGMKLKPKKCQLFQSYVVFLGRLVSSEGVHVPPGDIERVVNWEIPTGKREVQSFIGVVNFHRDHISLFAKVMGPTTTFVCGGDQQNALMC